MMKQALRTILFLALTSCGCKYVEPVNADKTLIVTLVNSMDENIFDQNYDINQFQLLCPNGDPVPVIRIDSVSNTVTFPLVSCDRIIFNDKTSIEYTLRLDSTVSEQLQFEYLASDKERCGGSKFEEIEGFFMGSTYLMSTAIREEIRLVLR